MQIDAVSLMLMLSQRFMGYIWDTKR